MEDAMVINKSSIERGFAHGAIYASEVKRTFTHFLINIIFYCFSSWLIYKN